MKETRKKKKTGVAKTKLSPELISKFTSLARRSEVPKPVYKEPDHFSVSSIGTFLDCRRLCWYTRIRQLVQKMQPEYYYIGRVWHSVLETLYNWKDFDAARRQIARAFKLESNSPWFTAAQNESMLTDKAKITGMLKGYEKQYGEEDFKLWKVVRSEITFKLPDFLNSGFDFTGRMDGAIQIDTGRHKGLWCLENKSASSIEPYQYDRAKIDTQLLGYICAATHILGQKPRGVIWNVVRKPSIRQKQHQTIEDYRRELIADYQDRPGFYFYRDFLPVSVTAMQQWEAEISNILLDFELACENLEDKSFWYKNPNQCTRFGRCPYLSLCTRGETRKTLMYFRIKSIEEDDIMKGKKHGKTAKRKREKEEARAAIIKSRRKRRVGED